MSGTGAQVNGPSGSSGKFIDGVDPDDPAYIKNLQRPAEVKEDLHQMENRSRVKMVLSSEAFRDELEQIVQEHLECGPYPETLMALKQITDLLVPQARGSFGNFGRAATVIPINDLRGVEFAGFAKGEKLLRCKLSAMYRLVDLCGWSHGIYNHISARVSQDDEHFLLNPFGMLYSEVTASSLIKVDVNGSVVEQGSSQLGVNKAGFTLHSAIHQARPDIKCIVHLHTPAAVAVSAMKCGFLPMSQEALIIGNVSYHDYKGIFIDADERELLARNLGVHNKVMFLRNHGVVACGETIEEAFHFTFNVMAACEAQVRAIPAGIDNIILPSEEARQQVFNVANKGGGGVETTGKKWKTGELEFEALMRTLDNSGYRTGYLYRMPMVKQDKKERSNSEVEIPPASSSFSYMFDGDETSKYSSPLKAAMERQKKAYKAGWLTTPNAYKKTEIEEIGTTTPKKITKWVSEGDSPNRPGGTPLKIESPNQFAPQGSNPKEYKEKQKSIKKDYYDERVSAGPQSKILDGMSWEEAQKAKDGQLSGAGDQLIVVGAASKGIIKRDHQNNAGVYRQYYAANPFENMSEAEIERYQKEVQRKEAGEPVEDVQPEIPQPQEVEDSNTQQVESLEPEGQDTGLAQLADKVVRTVIHDALAVARQGKGQQTLTGSTCFDAHMSNQCVMGGQTVDVQANANSTGDSRNRERIEMRSQPDNSSQNYTSQNFNFEQEDNANKFIRGISSKQAKLNDPPETQQSQKGDEEYVTIQVNPIHLYHGQMKGNMKIKFSIQSTIRRRICAELDRKAPIEEIYAAVTDPIIHHYETDSLSELNHEKETEETRDISLDDNVESNFESLHGLSQQFTEVQCSKQPTKNICKSECYERKVYKESENKSEQKNSFVNIKDNEHQKTISTAPNASQQTMTEKRDRRKKSTKPKKKAHKVKKTPLIPVQEYYEGTIEEMEEFETVLQNADDSFERLLITAEDSLLLCVQSDHEPITSEVLDLHNFIGAASFALDEHEEINTTAMTFKENMSKKQSVNKQRNISLPENNLETFAAEISHNPLIDSKVQSLNVTPEKTCEETGAKTTPRESGQKETDKGMLPLNILNSESASLKNFNNKYTYEKSFQNEEDNQKKENTLLAMVGSRGHPQKKPDDQITIAAGSQCITSKEENGSVCVPQKSNTEITHAGTIYGTNVCKATPEGRKTDEDCFNLQKPAITDMSEKLLFMSAYGDTLIGEHPSDIIASNQGKNANAELNYEEQIPFADESFEDSSYNLIYVDNVKTPTPVKISQNNIITDESMPAWKDKVSDDEPLTLRKIHSSRQRTELATSSHEELTVGTGDKVHDQGEPVRIFEKAVYDSPAVEAVKYRSGPEGISETTLDDPTPPLRIETIVDDDTDEEKLMPTRKVKAKFDEPRYIREAEIHVVTPMTANKIETFIDEPLSAIKMETNRDQSTSAGPIETAIKEPAPVMKVKTAFDEPKSVETVETAVNKTISVKRNETVISEPMSIRKVETIIIEPKLVRKVETRKNEPMPVREMETVIDEPMPVREMETAIDEPMPVRKMETAIDEPMPVREMETAIDEPMPVKKMETAIDEPMPVKKMETAIDEPIPVKKMETAIDEPMPVRKMETAIDEPMPVKKMETAIDEPMPVKKMETAIDEPMPVKKMETAIDEPMPVKKMETAIDEPMPVREMETAIDEPMPVKKMETAIDEPMPVREMETAINEPMSIREIKTEKDETVSANSFEIPAKISVSVRQVERDIDEPMPDRTAKTTKKESLSVLKVGTAVDEPMFTRTIETTRNEPMSVEKVDTTIDDQIIGKIEGSTSLLSGTETVYDQLTDKQDKTSTEASETALYDVPSENDYIENNMHSTDGFTSYYDTTTDKDTNRFNTANIIGHKPDFVDDSYLHIMKKMTTIDHFIKEKNKETSFEDIIYNKKGEKYIEDIIPTKKIETAFYDTVCVSGSDTDHDKVTDMESAKDHINDCTETSSYLKENENIDDIILKSRSQSIISSNAINQSIPESHSENTQGEDHPSSSCFSFDKQQNQEDFSYSSKNSLDEYHLKAHDKQMELDNSSNFFSPPVITVYPVTGSLSPVECVSPLPDTINVPSMSDVDVAHGRDRSRAQNPRVHAVSPPQVPVGKPKWTPKPRKQKGSLGGNTVAEGKTKVSNNVYKDSGEVSDTPYYPKRRGNDDDRPKHKYDGRRYPQKDERVGQENQEYIDKHEETFQRRRSEKGLRETRRGDDKIKLQGGTEFPKQRTSSGHRRHSSMEDKGHKRDGNVDSDDEEKQDNCRRYGGKKKKIHSYHDAKDVNQEYSRKDKSRVSSGVEHRHGRYSDKRSLKSKDQTNPSDVDDETNDYARNHLRREKARSNDGEQRKLEYRERHSVKKSKKPDLPHSDRQTYEYDESKCKQEGRTVLPDRHDTRSKTKLSDEDEVSHCSTSNTKGFEEQRFSNKFDHPIDEFLNSPRYEIDVEKSPRLQRRRGGAIAKEPSLNSKHLSPGKTKLISSVSSEHLLSPSTLPRRHKSSTCLVSSIDPKRSRSTSPRSFTSLGEASSHHQLDRLTGKPYNFTHPLMLSMESLCTGSNLSLRMLKAKSELSLHAQVFSQSQNVSEEEQTITREEMNLGETSALSNDKEEKNRHVTNESLLQNSETECHTDYQQHKQLEENKEKLRNELKDLKEGDKLKKKRREQLRKFGRESDSDSEDNHEGRRKHGGRRSQRAEIDFEKDDTRVPGKDVTKAKMDRGMDLEMHNSRTSRRSRRSRKETEWKSEEHKDLRPKHVNRFDRNETDAGGEEVEKTKELKHTRKERKIAIDETNMRRGSREDSYLEWKRRKEKFAAKGDYEEGEEKEQAGRSQKPTKDKPPEREQNKEGLSQEPLSQMLFSPVDTHTMNRDGKIDDILPPPKEGFWSKLSCVSSRSTDVSRKKQVASNKAPLEKVLSIDKKKKDLNFYDEGEKRKITKLSKDQHRDKTSFYFQQEDVEEEINLDTTKSLIKNSKDIEKYDISPAPKSMSSFTADSRDIGDFKNYFAEEEKKISDFPNSEEENEIDPRHDDVLNHAKFSEKNSRYLDRRSSYEVSSGRLFDDQTQFAGKKWEPRAKRDKQSNLKTRSSKSLERPKGNEFSGLLGEKALTSMENEESIVKDSANLAETSPGVPRNVLVSDQVQENSVTVTELPYVKRYERKLSFDNSRAGFQMGSPLRSGDSSPVRRRVSQVSLATGSSTSRQRSASTSSNPLIYQPWRSKARRHSCSMSISEMVYATGVPKPRSRSYSIGEVYNSSVARHVAHKRSRSSSVVELTSRMYQPHLRSHSRGSLGDNSLGSVAPLRQRKFSGSPSFPAEQRVVSAAPVKRSDSERQPSKNPELIEELDRKSKERGQSERRPKPPRQELVESQEKPVSPSKSDTLKSTDSASGGETLEERSSKEGSPTKEHPAPKDKKKKKKFRIPSFSKKKNKESKESAI